ncbi:MAG: glycine oxidase ThiO [Bryobacterales bacterium]|nr:glycine oxidase ThiO [Bryobacterales bacterium]
MRPSQPDILIAGAGIIGASLAWQLARKGCRVLVCDAGKPGGEASWAGAGMLAPASEYEKPGEWLDFALHSLALYREFVRRLEEDSGVGIEFSQCGSLEIASGEKEFSLLRDRAIRQRQSGIETQIFPPAELPGRVPRLAPSAGGAVFYPNDGQVDPRTVSEALRAALSRRGVELRKQTRVANLYPHASGVDVRLGNGETVSTTMAVICAGAWSSQIAVAGYSLVEAFPVKGHLVGYRLPPGTLPHVIRCGRTYIVQRTTGYTIAGSSEERAGFDRNVDAGIVSEIHEAAVRLAPGLLPARPDDAWTGFRPATALPHPLIEQLGESPVWLAYGHYRNGILLAPATAERLTKVLTASLGMD